MEQVLGYSSEYLYNTGSGAPVNTHRSIIGRPDVYPKMGSSASAWAPRDANGGYEWVTFSVDRAVYVTGVTIYETNHPGAVKKVLGRQNQNTQWETLWEGAVSPPPGTNVRDPATGRMPTAARKWVVPGVAAPRKTRLKEFKVEMDTAAVSEHNDIDAIEIHGDDIDGAPYDQFTPACGKDVVADCWRTCGADDVLPAAAQAELLDVLSDAAAWATRALRVPDMNARLAVVAAPDEDPAAVSCDGVEVPAYLRSPGVRTELAVVVTARRPPLNVGNATHDGPATPRGAMGDPSLVSVSACRHDATSASLGRPTVLHVNADPGFAAGFASASAADRRATVDVALHYLFRGLGWSAAYHAQFAASPGVNVVSCPNGCSVDNTAAGVTWATRDLRVIKTPALVKAAEAHFGVVAGGLASRGVELENDASLGARGVLLERRVFNGELMTVPVRGERRHRSKVSLAYLEDTGWYLPDYSAAEPLEYGYLQGVDFVTNPPNLWPVSATRYTCPTKSTITQGLVFNKGLPNAPSCTFDRTSKGQCALKEWPNPLPGPLQYFERPVEGNFGGVDPVADYAPYSAATANGAGDCRVAANKATGQYFEWFGEASRCFDVTRNGVASVGCFRHACVNDKLYVLAEDAEGFLLCEDNKIVQSARGISITCPRTREMCDTYGTNVAVSLDVYSPEADALIGPNITAAVRLNNFASPGDGYVRVTLAGVEVGRLASAAAPGARHTFPLSLPEGRYALAFELVGAGDVVVFQRNVSVEVRLARNGWIQAALNATSAAADNPVTAMQGAPDVTSYGNAIGGTWSPLHGGSGGELVDVRFTPPMFVERVKVHETFSNGALTSVAALIGPDGAYDQITTALTPEPIWAGTRGEVTPPNSGLLPPREVTTRHPSARVDKIRLGFTTPSWVRVDAVEVYGLLETRPALTQLSPKRIHVTVLQGEKKTVTVRVRKTGSAALMWTVDDPTFGNSSTWLSAPRTVGLLRADGEEASIDFVFDGAVATATPVMEKTVTLENLYGLKGGANSLASFTFVFQMDYSMHPLPPPPLCYRGVVVNRTLTNAGTCMCEPGASGLACEYRSCARDCHATAAYPKGICDHRTGTCMCNPGYSGVDCSGQDGDCYVSYDGTCRAGWEKGAYVLNGEDRANYNFASGTVPQSLACNESEARGNPFACSQFAKIDFCCRRSAKPGCPFFADAPVCGDARCTSDGNFSSVACRPAVVDHCFYNATDPACNAFRPIPPPPGYCPRGLAHEYCADKPTDKDCVDLHAPRAKCGFAAAPGIGDNATSPCVDPACAGGDAALFSAACRLVISAYCEKNPTDRECELHGLGDGCLFLPGSPPCEADACTSGAPEGAACRAVVAQYCLGARSTPDPQCSILGYAPPLASSSPVDTRVCPMAAARKRCAGDQLATRAECLQMYMGGIITRRLTADEMPGTSALAATAAKEREAALKAFVAAGTARDAATSDNVARTALYASLWRDAEANGDGYLSATELTALIRNLATRVASGSEYGARFFTGKDFEAKLLAAKSGDMLTYDEVAAALEGLFDAA